MEKINKKEIEIHRNSLEELDKLLDLKRVDLEK
jgi:hypothetical protein